MTRRALAVLAIPIVLALAACGPADDPDRCVPPSPSPTGAPWVEADDGEPCVPGPDGWTEQPDGHRVVAPHRRATVTPTRRAVTQPATTKRTTKVRRTLR